VKRHPGQVGPIIEGESAVEGGVQDYGVSDFGGRGRGGGWMGGLAAAEEGVFVLVVGEFFIGYFVE